MTTNSNRSKFLSLVLGNIIMCVTVVAIVAVAFSGGGATNADSGAEPIYSGKSTTKISLMINVYWGTEYVEPMLKIFERYNVKTTFFVGGSWAVGNAETLKKIVDGGHEIANHGYYHKDHSKLDLTANKREIETTHQAVKETIGVDMNLFAPPSGAYCNQTLLAAEELGYKTIMWTRDTIDWRDHDQELIYKRAVKNLSGGDLVLMHPTDTTVKALERIVIEVFSQGLKISTVTDVLTPQNFA